MSRIETSPSNKTRKRPRSSLEFEIALNANMEDKNVHGSLSCHSNKNDNYKEISRDNRDSLCCDEQSSTTKTFLSRDDMNCQDNRNNSKGKSERSKPNASLTDQERKEKQKLKKRLKLLTRIGKLETRIRHAISRKDKIVEEQAKDDLNKLIHQVNTDTTSTSCSDKKTCILNGIHEDREKVTYKEELIVKKEIISIANSLFCFANNSNCEIINSKNEQNNEAFNDSCHPNNDAQIGLALSSKGTSPFSAANSKRIQNEKAVKLLKHFTKGTQSHSMFRDHNALWGYTRQKFTERATLVYKSLSKLHPEDSTSNSLPSDKQIIKNSAWQNLKEVKFACSIGCGPGNDAVGLLAFLRHHVYKKFDNGVQETNFLLLDWAISDWEETVLQPLHSILEEKNWISTKKRYQNNHNSIQNEHSSTIDRNSSMKFAFCDVTESIDSDENKKSFEIFHYDPTIDNLSRNPNKSEEQKSCIRISAGVQVKDTVEAKGRWPFDIYLTSYLISETRGKWETFYKQLMNFAKPGAIFYFAEPTPWQLHRLCEICDDVLEFLWVDSSMCHEELQILDRRVGPAVLLGIRKSY